MVTLKNPIEYEDVMDKNYNIDMYIAKENHKQEIHLKGYDRFMINIKIMRTKIILYGGLEHGEF